MQEPAGALRATERTQEGPGAPIVDRGTDSLCSSGGG